MMRALFLLLTACAAASSAAGGAVSARAEAAASIPAPAPPQADHSLPAVHEDDYLLLRLEAGAFVLGEDIEGYRLPDGGVCLDLAQFARAVEFPIQVDRQALSASGWFRSEEDEFVLRPDRVRYAGHRERIGDGELHTHPGGLCAHVGALGRWFGLTFAPDLSSSLVRLSSETPLPAEKALERARRRQALARQPAQLDLDDLPAHAEPYRWWRTPSVDLIANIGGARPPGRHAVEPSATYAVYAAGELAKLSFDAQLSSNADAEPSLLRLRAYRQDAEGRLFGSLGLTEVVAGDVTLQQSGILLPTGVGRGAYLTNAPLVRAVDFDVTSFFGELPEGWEAELYRNGALIAFTEPSASGRYEFRDVPLLYGDNRFEILLYGPQGQVRTRRVLRRVGEDLVPAGSTWIRAGVVEDSRSLIDLRARPPDPGRLQMMVAADHGLTKTLSLGAALHAIEDAEAGAANGPLRPYIEASLRKSVAGATLEVDGASDFEGGRAAALRAAGRAGNLSFYAASLVQDGILSERTDADIASEHELRAIREFDLADRPGSLSLRARYRERRTGSDTLEISGQMASSLAGILLTQEVGWRRRIGLSQSGEVAARTQIGGRLGAVSLRGEAHYLLAEQLEFERARATAAYRLSPSAQLRGEGEYEHRSRRGRLSLGYAHRFQRFALGGEVTADTDGGLAIGLNLALSVGPDAHGRFANVSSDRLAGRGQVAARVFTDMNGDGSWQEDEPLHEGVQVAQAPSLAGPETGADGTVVLSGLTSGARSLIAIHRPSVDDPYLLPAGEGVVVVPRRGVASRIDLPLLPTGEIEGILRRKGLELPGATLVLADRQGRTVAEARSEYDGFFLFERVPYGEYRLLLGAESQAALGAERLPEIQVLVGGDRPVRNLGDVHLQP